jgi:hypothetical protein
MKLPDFTVQFNKRFLTFHACNLSIDLVQEWPVLWVLISEHGLRTVLNLVTWSTSTEYCLLKIYNFVVTFRS